MSSTLLPHIMLQKMHIDRIAYQEKWEPGPSVNALSPAFFACYQLAERRSMKQCAKLLCSFAQLPAIV